MFKGKFVVLSLIVAALFVWQILPAGVHTASSGIVDGCQSTATSAGACVVVCPQGDGDVLSAPVSGGDATISVTVNDNTGTPIPGIAAADFWLIGCSDGLALCGGSGAINASAASDALGQTTITGALAAGACDNGVLVVVQGTIVGDPGACGGSCLAIVAHSPDINGDLSIDLLDFDTFGKTFKGTLPFNACLDYNCDGVVDLIDFAVFGNHFGHAC